MEKLSFTGRTDRRLLRLRRGLLGLTVLAVLWCVAIALSGGFILHVAGVRVSSRNVWNPLLLASASAVAVAGLTGRSFLRLVSADVEWALRHVERAYVRSASSPLLRWLGPALFIAVIGAALQIYQWWGGRPLWADEEMIALNIRDRSFRDLAGPLWLGQSAPLGWLAVQRTALLLFEGGERVLRLVPLLFNLGLLAAAGWVGRRWMTPAGAAALVLLCAFGQWVSAYSLELKHYSGDIYFGLLLPALVVWVVEGNGPRERLQRAACWWAVVAAGQWLANGPVLIAPASVVILSVAMWRMDGRRMCVAIIPMGVTCLAMFGIHYFLSLRFTVGSDYLREYWRGGMAPAGADVLDRLGWLFQQAAPLAATPVGSGLEGVFWLTSICGLLLGRPRLLTIAFATVPLSASVLALIRIVPLSDRIALWVVPSLYVGVALAIDAGVRWAREGYQRRIVTRAAIGAIVACTGVWVCIDATARGWRDVMIARPRDSNHALDDRAAVRWLLSRKQPGDVVLTTSLGLPAVWWYGGASIAPPASGGFLPDGTRIMEVTFIPGDAPCPQDVLSRALAGHRRVLVYFGFAIDDVAPGFAELLLRRLESIGDVEEFRRFSGTSRAAVIERRRAPASSGQADRRLMGTELPHGCVEARPAMRW